jgi:hypothetical protein
MKKIFVNQLDKSVKFIIAFNFLLVANIAIFGQNDTPNIFEETDAEIQKLHDTALINHYSTLNTITTFKKDIAKNKYATEYMNHYSSNLGFRRRVFEWQLLSSKFIFFIVMVVVLSGILFSGLQFYQSFKLTSKFTRMANSKNLEQIEKIIDQESSKIEVSPTGGFSVTTSIVGLLVLGVSIGFFYLYLNHVYPINEKQMDNPKELNAQINKMEENAAKLDSPN